VRLFADVLEVVPESRLLLKSRQLADPAVAQAVRTVFEAQGVAAERLALHGRIPGRTHHLAFYEAVDVALDTTPYNGTTTSCEALLMGVPVVTRAGTLHPGRVGASLLKAAGHPEWVAESDAAFVAIAAALAKERPGRAVLRETLLSSPLTDGQRFTRRLETALREAWRAWCARPAD
jgi:protein O-GlcNAc transferase